MAETNYIGIAETNNGFTYQYYKIGDSGKKLIFLHGLAGCKDAQPYFFRKLLPDNTCYFLDLPGHNNLTLNGITDSESFYLYLKSFIDSKKLDNPVLVGFSIGGNVAYYFAKKYLTDTGIVLPTVLWSSPIFINETYLTPRGRFAIFLLSILPRNTLKSKGSLEFLNKFVRKIGIPLTSQDLSAIMTFDSSSVKLYRKFLQLPIYPTDPRERTLFVYGTNDVFIDDKIFEVISTLNNSQQKFLVENGGHFSKDAFQQNSVEKIKTFIDSI